MNSTKEWLMETWRFRAHLYWLWKGIKRIAKEKRSAIFSIVCWSIFLFITGFVFKGITEKFWIDVFFITGYFCYLIYKGKPKGAGRIMRDFIRIGLVNHAYETPLLMKKYYEKNYFVLVFRNCGIPLSKWNDLKDTIEAGINYNIVCIEERGKKWIVIKAISGDIVLPTFVRWNDSYLTPEKEFTLALGEGYQGKVTVDLRKTPHMLIGGSTGSGKSILGKNLIYQCLKKNAEVIIADFKGGVDFSKKWHTKCTFITEQEPLIQKLNEIVIDLHNRKTMFADLDCANIDEYNQKYNRHLQRIVFFCDEVAEIIDKTGLNKEQKQKIAEIEANLATIARLGRAFGIHLILSTQRPDANILSGQIKNNIDIRVCGRADDVLSQIILDKTDASDLIHKDAQGRFLTNDDVLFQGYWFEDSML